MDISSLSHLHIEELTDAYRSRTTSPVEVAQLMLDQIDAVEGRINALYDVDHERVLSEAEASERRHASGQALSDFDGVPVTIKDSVHAVGMHWHHGSAGHGRGVVGTKDAPPAKRLKKAGAIILGKGKMPDFGLSGSGVSGSHGIVRNPWGLKWNTGGSSAGAGASIASGIGMMSVGTDIAGSVRLPACHCGLAALKPTQGVVPHTPASHERSAGPITRHAADLHAWTTLLGGPDPDDRYSFPYLWSKLDRPLKIGVSTDFGFGPAVEKPVLDCIDTARDALASLGHELVQIEKTAGFDAYKPIDESLKIRGWLEYRSLAPEFRDNTPQQLVDWFQEAETWTPDIVKDINDGIERGVAFCNDLLEGVDVLLTPVMPIVNFPAEDRGIDPAMPLRHSTFTAPFNQSGQPAVSLCGGFDDRGLPIGVQLVARRLEDSLLLQLATALEAALAIYGPDKKQWPLTPQE